MRKVSLRLTHGELLKLKRLNTPTIYNGWERITRQNPGGDCFNLEETRDFMPHMGPMAGYAVTVVIEPSNPEHRKRGPHAWSQYRRYVAGQPGPKIVVVQDLDKPRVIGSFWGEVSSNNDDYYEREFNGQDWAEIKQQAIDNVKWAADRVRVYQGTSEAGV